MSMLAERKRKQKWSLNPRGKDWAQDSNKFGQKLLEKMGWQQGKGLGAKEDGITEHVKVSYKNDSKGMGYKESDDQWTEHETNFSALLESLTGDAAVPKEIKVNSLEKKSQASRARVHYHKFTRGKDLSRYSEKDLANIFGKKSLTKEEKDCKQVDNSEENSESVSKFLLNAGSMRDYFKKKLPSFGKSAGYFVGSNGVLAKGESDSETEIRPSFGFGYKENGQSGACAGFGFKSEVNSNQESSENASKSKATFVSYLNGEENIESEKKIKKKRKSVPTCDDSVFSPKKKLKKDDDAPSGVSNPAFDPLRTPVKVQKHVLNTIEESAAEEDFEIVETEVEIHERISRKEGDVENQQTSKRKQGKRKQNGLENPTLNIGSEENLYEIKTEEKKKKFTNNSLNKVDGMEDITENIQENPYEVKIKKNKKRNGATEPSVVEIVEASIYEVKVKEKTKKKALKSVLENPTFNYSSEESFQIEENDENCAQNVNTKRKNKEKPLTENALEENPFEVRIKRKKKKHKEETFAMDNPEFDPSDSLNTNSVNNVFEVERKTKKPKKTKEEMGVANLALNLNSSHSENEESFKDGVSKNTFEVERKKKKSKKAKEEVGVANPALGLDNSLIENEDSFVQSGLDGVNNTFEVQRKKKKLKKAKEDLGVINPVLNIDNLCLKTEELEDLSLINGQFEENSSNNAFEIERKKKKSKRVKEAAGIVNPALDLNSLGLQEENFEDLAPENAHFEESGNNNALPVASKKKKLKKITEEAGMTNTALNLNDLDLKNEENLEDLASKNAQFEESGNNEALPVLRKKKKSKRITQEAGVVNPNLDLVGLTLKNEESLENLATKNALFEEIINNNALEVERSKKKSKKMREEPGAVSENPPVDAECDLMLNVVATPVVAKPEVASSASLSVKRRKSVRFSDVAQARIIPNNDELRTMSEVEYREELFGINAQVMSRLEGQGGYPGLDNVAFDSQRTKLEENLESISKRIDKYQAQVENDINEKKLESVTMEDIMIGEVGNPHGEHEKLRDGTKLKFKYAHFESRTPFYQLDKTGSKKSYKHLIKGDIVVKFRNTNLHEIDGYAVRSKRTVV